MDSFCYRKLDRLLTNDHWHDLPWLQEYFFCWCSSLTTLHCASSHCRNGCDSTSKGAIHTNEHWSAKVISDWVTDRSFIQDAKYIHKHSLSQPGERGDFYVFRQFLPRLLHSSFALLKENCLQKKYIYINVLYGTIQLQNWETFLATMIKNGPCDPKSGHIVAHNKHLGFFPPFLWDHSCDFHN